MGGGAGVDVVFIALLAVGQRGDGERCAALRRVFGADELGECFVGGDYVVVDGVGDLLRQALLVVGEMSAGYFLVGQQKWIGVDDALALDRELFPEGIERA